MKAFVWASHRVRGSISPAIGGTLAMDVRIEERQPVATAVVRGAFDLSAFMSRLDAVYAALAGRKGGQNIALYTDDAMEVGVEYDGWDDAGVGVIASALPGGRVASAIHTTGYGDLGRTYDAILGWCSEHGHGLAGPRWEIYGDPDEHDHVDVEVCYLLA
jgi:effector-binding domain-containing protein